MKVSGDKLNSQMQGLTATQGSRTGATSAKAKGLSAEAGSRSEKVNLSERAQTMQRAKELASQQMEQVDMEKVARLQKLIDEGNYKTDAATIADRLVNEHLMASES